MKYQDFNKAFSTARLNKYLIACGGNYKTALQLYRYNLRLCQKLYGMLGVFEIVLRNAINDHYITYYSDPNWIKNQVNPGGMLEMHPHKADIVRIINDLMKAGRYTNDRVVSSVSFGFWTYLFNKVPYRRGGKNLLKIFPAKTKGLGQREIYNELISIKAFRNKIAHHEAICFDATGSKNTQLVKNNYALIIKYIKFMGYSEKKLYRGFNSIPDAMIKKIDAL